MDNNQLFKEQFCLAKVHRFVEPNDYIVFYPSHRDKVGNLLTFFQTCGDSFVSIVYPWEKPPVAVTDYDIKKTSHGADRMGKNDGLS